MTRPPDPFGTAELRRAVLAGWAASAARFREDANAEEELALGAYRDRLVVELAQNAADAATRAGVPGRLRFALSAEQLTAANTGAPLDADGVRALATLRASAKRGEPTVGRFGVGFAAVLAAADGVEIASRDGGIRFDAAESRAAAAELPGLTDEITDRRGHVPVLRLPWPAPADPPDGFATEVRLRLRPGGYAVAHAALAELSVELLLALPGLDEVEIGVDADGVSGHRVLRRIAGPSGPRVALEETRGDEPPRRRTWRVVRRSGLHPPELVAGRPVEEQDRPQWSVLVAVPVDDVDRPLGAPEDRVVHAPTPTDEPLSLPVRLIASYPLASDRRRVAPGRVTDAITSEVAAAYADLVRDLPVDPGVVDLAPRPGLAAGELDAAIRSAVETALRSTEWLPEAGTTRRRRPTELRALAAATPGLLALAGDVLSGLLPAEWCEQRLGGVLGGLGVTRLGIAELADELSRVDRPPSWWRELYAALEAVVPAIPADHLAGLPVPLTDGRLVVGPRGLLRPGSADLPPGLDVLGLRVVDPDAAHPMLDRLGARSSTVAAMLTDERVRAAVTDSIEAEDPQPVADAVLALVAAADLAPGALPWLGRLALHGDDGESYPADELVVPGSPVDAILGPTAGDDAPLAAVDPALLERWGADVLTAVGVLRTFAVVSAEPDELDVDGAEQWYAEARRLADDVRPSGELVRAVADLDLIPADRWPQALALLSGPQLRPVVLDAPWPGVPSYTRWWLSRHPVIAGERPDRLRLPGAVELAGLYDVAPGDPDAARLAGALTGLDAALSTPGAARDLVDRVADPRRTVPAGVFPRVYARLAAVLDATVPADPPERVRVAPGRVVPAADAVVPDAPYLLPLLSDRPLVPAGGVPAAVADLLDLPLASEVVTDEWRVTSQPAHEVDWADVAGAELAAARLGRAEPLTGRVAFHDGLAVGRTRVDWWPGGATADPDAGPLDHVDSAAGGPALGRALAWRHGQWSARAALAECFEHPANAARLAAEDSCPDSEERV